MKKLILIIILYFNIFPIWKDGKIIIFQNSFINAQATYTIPPGTVLGNASNLLNYCRSLPGSSDFQFVIEGNGVRATNLNTNTSQLLVLTQGTTAASIATTLGLPMPTTSTSTTNTGSENGDEGDQEDNWLELTSILNQLSANPQQDAIDEYYAILNSGGPSYEPTNNTTTCDPALSLGWMNTTSYSEALLPDNSASVNIITPDLPCKNKFLLFGNIVSFPTDKVPTNSTYNFNGGAITSVTTPNGDKYSYGLKYDVVIDVNEVISYSPECGGGASTTDITFSNERKTYKFICFSKIAQVSGVTSIEGHKKVDGTAISGYEGIPENSAYSFTIPNSSIVPAQVGNQVMTKTKDGVPYCITLTQEDIKRGFSAERDKKYIPPSVEIKLQHHINAPQWVRDFLELFNIPLEPCTIQKINAGLDALHAKPEYINEPIEGNKAVMEYKSMAYDMLFGAMYCAVGEEAAVGKSCAEQIAMGVLHEAISSIDVAQMRDGIVNIVKGLGNLVQQNVKDLTDGVKDIVQETTTSGIYNMESVAKKIIKKNVTGLESVYNKAIAFADQFKQMYFTNCGQICCYRQGEIAMMIVPILLTAGDYAVVKLQALALKYGTRAADAIKIFSDAERLGAKVVNDVDKILIKESDDVDALVITTQEKVGNDITITGEQQLDNIIDVDDLKDVDVPNPVVNNEIVANPGNKANGWNKKLSKQLESNKTYKVGNTKYKTKLSDGNPVNDGRVFEITCDDLILNPNDANKYQQTYKCKKVKDGLPGDDGGHLIGKQFGGAGEQINYVPMKSGINQAPGTWYTMEKEWRDALLVSGGTVKNVKITVNYGSNRRPTGFTVTADVNGIPNQWTHVN